MIPAGGPHIHVVQGERHICTEGTEDFYACSGPLSHPWAAGLAYPDHIALRDNDGLSDAGDLNVVCHEMMHLVADVGDAYTYDPLTGITRWWYPGVDSCVHNWNPLPGEYDRALLQSRYGISTNTSQASTQITPITIFWEVANTPIYQSGCFRSPTPPSRAPQQYPRPEYA